MVILSDEIVNIISTHTPLAGRDWGNSFMMTRYANFYSHAPCGTWPPFVSSYMSGAKISTHTPLAGRDEKMDIEPNEETISTHTPLAGRDPIPDKSGGYFIISTHTPLAGRDEIIAESGNEI